MVSFKNFEKKNRIDAPRLFLRPMAESDAKLIISWRNLLSNESHSVFFNEEKHLNIKQHLSWFKNQRKNRIDYVFCERLNEKPIGTVHFKKIDKLLGVAEAGKILGDLSYRKMGFAREAFAIWLKYGFEDLDLKHIYIFTDINNITNINLNLKLGFRILEETKISSTKQNFLKMEISKEAIYNLNKILNL